MSLPGGPGGPRLELRLPDRRFAAGQELTGRVVLRADHPVPCTALHVRAWWAARGRDPSTDEIRIAAEATLHEGGELAPGEAFSFRLRLPDGPPTFRGELVQIRWSVTARLRRPRLHPLTERVRITVDPPAIEPAALPDVAAAWLDRWRRFTRPRAIRDRLRVAATSLAAATVVTLVADRGAHLLGRAPHPAAVTVPAVAAAATVFWRRRRRVPSRRARVVAPGERVILPFTPSDPADPMGVRWVLLRVEEASRRVILPPRAGRRRRPVQWDRIETEMACGTVSAAEAAAAGVSVPIPAEPPAFLLTADRRVTWEVELRARRRGREVTHRVPLVVVPCRVDAS